MQIRLILKLLYNIFKIYLNSYTFSSIIYRINLIVTRLLSRRKQRDISQP